MLKSSLSLPTEQMGISTVTNMWAQEPHQQLLPLCRGMLIRQREQMCVFTLQPPPHRLHAQPVHQGYNLGVKQNQAKLKPSLGPVITCVLEYN